MISAMSDMEKRRLREQSPGEVHKDRRVQWAAAGVLAIVVIVFVAQNSRHVRIDFLFWNSSLPLVWVLVVMVVVGMLIDRLLLWRGNRKR
jgi:uncharacterized integral membrane protein